MQSVTVTKITKPKRKVIIKRGIKATHYFEYVNEVGCDIWEYLKTIPSICGEPVCLWLPRKYVKPHTSIYVQGAEVSPDYQREIPEGFDVIELPEAEYLMFKGPAFKEENFDQAIKNVWKAMEEFKPEELGLKWDDDNPKIQLEPIGERGYIELRAVKQI